MVASRIGAFILFIVSAAAAMQAQSASPEEVRQLIAQLAYPEQDRRDAASTVLRALPKEKVIPFLMQALGNEYPGLEQTVTDLVKRLSSRTWSERDRATRDLVIQGRKARSYLEASLSKGDEETRWRIHAVLLHIRDQEPQEEVRDFLQKREICRLLADIGDASCRALLVRTLKVKDLEIRKTAIEAIVKLKLKAAAGDLAKALSDSDPREQCWLVRALGELGGEESLSPIVDVLGRTDDTQLKDRCLGALARIGTAGAVKAMIEHLEAENSYAAQNALVHLIGLTRDDFGFDPNQSRAENRAAIRRFIQWWEKKFKTRWKE